MIPALLFLASYLIGAIPFGYLVARGRGVDILRQGSGNIGATNVGRVLGRRWGIVVFLLDFAKGAVPVLVAMSLREVAAGLPPQALPVGAGVAAFLGHLFPVYLRFRGGKGVATAAGVMAVLVPLPFLAAFVCWLTVFVSTRFMSLASLVAAAVLCALRLILTPNPWAPDEAVLSGFCLAAAALVVARHHANIRRLLHGTENRFRDTPAMNLLNKTLHVLAVGLWFGTVVFFTVTGAVLFPTLDKLAAEPADRRPVWLPVPEAYEGPAPGEGFPDPPRREQGARIAGAVVGPLFPWYFGVQAGCGIVALVTALAWIGRAREKVHRVRAVLLTAALACVGVGWWLERVVDELRGPRNDLTDAVLRSKHPSTAEVSQARQARQAFATWHGYSLAINFSTLLLVLAAAALAAQLPGASQPAAPPNEKLQGASAGPP
jgi:acyl-phosphate glycerol 3-phosphate acyltransferase